MARVRVRQHVNPLSSKYRKSVSLPSWDQVYANPSLGFHLDLGCARGRFLLEMAQTQVDRNYLGVEIREPLVIIRRNVLLELLSESKSTIKS